MILSDCDVVILGGGPSGTAAGMTLQKYAGIAVTVVEASDYAAPRIGESLSPGVRPLLAYLDLWEPFTAQHAMDAFGSQAAWGGAALQALDYMFTLHGTGWNLDRAGFDQFLAATFVQRGGQLLTNTRFLRGEQTATGWRVYLQGAEASQQTLRCRYLIDATGRQGKLIRQLGVTRTVHDHLVGIGCIAQLPHKAELAQVVLVEACEYGWWYTALIPGNRLSIVLMSDGDLVNQAQMNWLPQWQSLLRATEHTRKRVQGVQFNQALKTFPSFSACLQQVGGESWVAVGDTVASYDPLSASGIPHAISSGVNGAIVAAEALLSNNTALESYQHAIHQQFRQYLQMHWQYYQQENRWPQAVFWQRRRTPITTHPNASIEQVESATKLVSSMPIHLSKQLLQQLYKHCRLGSLVHQVVRDFANAHPNISEQNIILGFQELVKYGCVRVVPPI